MLVSNPRVRAQLRAIVRGIARNSSDHDDLLQEALIHLWRSEATKPGQTVSWYLQSCKYFALDYLKRGKSVDSKLRTGCFLFSMDDQNGTDSPPPELTSGHDFREQIFASDALELLRERLTDRQRNMLEAFAGGASVSEVSERLGCSHQYVSKERKKMAAALQAVLV